MDKQSSFNIFLALVLALTWAAGPVFAENAPATETEAETARQATTTPEAAPGITPLGFGGLRVFVDPTTGRIVADPSAEARLNLVFGQELLRRMDTSHEDLVQQPGPEGGTMVHLEGRFMSPLVAVVNADGSVRMDHAALAPAPTNTRDKAKEASDETP